MLLGAFCQSGRRRHYDKEIEGCVPRKPIWCVNLLLSVIGLLGPKKRYGAAVDVSST